MTDLLLIFFVAFFVNLLYELFHSVLYKTCIEAPLPRYIFLILKAAIFDGFSITIIYLFVSLSFANNLQIIMFLAISLGFAFFWEKYSLAKRKWEYLNTMPTILGVGVTPFIQLALTGLLSIYISFYLR